MLLLPTHSTLRSPLLQVHHQLHSHRKHSKVHTCKALSKGTPRGFLTSKCYLLYSQEYRVTNICNPNTSVKYLYKLHSPALKAFAQHCMAHSCETCIWYGAICMHWWFFFLPNTSINDIRLLWSEKHNRGDREIEWKVNARTAKWRVESLGRGTTSWPVLYISRSCLVSVDAGDIYRGTRGPGPLLSPCLAAFQLSNPTNEAQHTQPFPCSGWPLHNQPHAVMGRDVIQPPNFIYPHNLG